MTPRADATRPSGALRASPGCLPPGRRPEAISGHVGAVPGEGGPSRLAPPSPGGGFGGRGGGTPPPRELRRKVSSPSKQGVSGEGSPATPPADQADEWTATAPPSLVRLQATARELGRRFGLGSMTFCGTTPLGSEVAYVVDVATGKRGGVAGVGRCGQAGCPKCDSIEARERAAEIEHAIAWWQARGGHVFHVIKTVPHTREDDPRELRIALAEAQKRLYQGRSWMELREAWALGDAEHFVSRMHYTRSFEVTYGDNGSHPHAHGLYFVGDHVELDDVLREMRVRWAEASECALGRTPHERIGVVARKVEDDADDRARVSSYVSKTGNDIAWEVAGGALKMGGFEGDDGGDERKGTTPARMLFEASHGSEASAKRWADHIRAWKGARRFSWSRGFRALVGEYEEQEPEATRVVLMVPRDSHRSIARDPHAFKLVLAALADGRRAALWAIARHVDPYVADFVDAYSRDYAGDAMREAIDAATCVEETPMLDRARALDRVERAAWSRRERSDEDSGSDVFEMFAVALSDVRGKSSAEGREEVRDARNA